MTVESKLDITGKMVTGIIQGSIFPITLLILMGSVFYIFFTLITSSLNGSFLKVS
tara:strand:- start:630 stop:794 length:165 start_codon:yes stop_codon:yes gene_type:complete